MDRAPEKTSHRTTIRSRPLPPGWTEYTTAQTQTPHQTRRRSHEARGWSVEVRRCESEVASGLAIYVMVLVYVPRGVGLLDGDRTAKAVASGVSALLYGDWRRGWTQKERRLVFVV